MYLFSLILITIISPAKTGLRYPFLKKGKTLLLFYIIHIYYNKSIKKYIEILKFV